MRANDRARKLDPFAAPKRETEGASPSLGSWSFLTTRTSKRAIFSRVSHRGVFIAASLCTIVVFALPANVRETRDTVVAQDALSHAPAMVRVDSSAVANRTPLEVNATRQPPPANPAVLALPSPAPRVAAAQPASLRSPPRAQAKLAPSSPARQLALAKGSKLAAAKLPRIPPATAVAPVVQPAPPTLAEAPVRTAAKREVPLHDNAVTAFNEALEQCAEGSMFARTWCEHRARTRFCNTEGSSRPECAAAINVEHGG